MPVTHKDSEVLLEISCEESDVDEILNVRITIQKRQVKAGGYIWKFHKTDMDEWPSKLHGHDYDRNLKLDAVTGEIWDVGTRNNCKTLKSKILLNIQKHLFESADFTEKCKKHFTCDTISRIQAV